MIAPAPHEHPGFRGFRDAPGRIQPSDSRINDALEGGPTLGLGGFVGFASAFLQTDLPRDPVAFIVPAGCVLSDLL
jgi:hypothetical protein